MNQNHEQKHKKFEDQNVGSSNKCLSQQIGYCNLKD